MKLTRIALKWIQKLPEGQAELAAQLRSAAQSTVANIAEGAGRRTRAEKRKNRMR